MQNDENVERRDDGPLDTGDTSGQQHNEANKRFFAENEKPAPKQERTGGICTRLELLLAAAVTVLTLIRRGLPISRDEIVDGTGLLPRYCHRSGLKRVLGDALGHAGRDCAKLWRNRDGAVLAVRENVSLLHKAIPSELWRGVIERAGWASETELVEFAEMLPSAVDG
jgi:hypothetical protein